MGFSFSGMVSNKVGVDLGTANTLVYVKGYGVVADEPSIVAIDAYRGEQWFGKEAKEMQGRTPGEMSVIRPMKDGAIADLAVTEVMLAYFMRKTPKRGLFYHPDVVIAVPSGITDVERRAVRDAALRAKARTVHLIAEPMAAAIGVGLPIHAPRGSMIIDVGGGTSEIAVIALSGIVCNSSIRVGGDEMDEDIVQYLKRNYNLFVGDRTAEQIKIELGSAWPLEQELEATVKGMDLVSAIPKTTVISSEEVREALSDSVGAIIDAVRQCLEKTPPELAADILDRGIILSGGGALLRGLDHRLREEINLPIHLVDDPLRCVVNGTGKVLEHLDLYSKVLF